MDPDPFSLIAEIGATLAGFAAIAGVIRSDPVDRDAALDKEANAEGEPIAAVAMGVTAMPLMGLIPILSLCAALDVPAGGAARVYAFALGACISVALAVLLYLLAKHLVYRR